ncbi:hypothetical protein SODG_002750 [Sodalis praecaptivus]
MLIIGYHHASAEVNQHLSLDLDQVELLGYAVSTLHQLKFGPRMRHATIIVTTHHCLKGLLIVFYIG